MLTSADAAQYLLGTIQRAVRDVLHDLHLAHLLHLRHTERAHHEALQTDGKAPELSWLQQ